MASVIALLQSGLPDELMGPHGHRLHVRGDGVEAEWRFAFRESRPLLPVWHEGVLRLARWGNRDRRGNLPPTGWTWLATVRGGGWGPFGAELVDIPCDFACEKGVWYRVRQGMRGILVPGPDGPCVYMICEPATRYYRVMTKSERMPVLIDEVI